MKEGLVSPHGIMHITAQTGRLGMLCIDNTIVLLFLLSTRDENNLFLTIRVSFLWGNRHRSRVRENCWPLSLFADFLLDYDIFSSLIVVFLRGKASLLVSCYNVACDQSVCLADLIDKQVCIHDIISHVRWAGALVEVNHFLAWTSWFIKKHNRPTDGRPKRPLWWYGS